MGQSTVYPLLYNLEARGHVKAVWRSSPAGRRRKYYRATASGRTWLERQRSQWATLVAAMANLGVTDAPPTPDVQAVRGAQS
jgi:PadR family transcriptional regulator PadR